MAASGLVSCVCGIIVGVFFIYELYLASAGMTTNEQFKWSDLQYEMEVEKKTIECDPCVLGFISARRTKHSIKLLGFRQFRLNWIKSKASSAKNSVRYGSLKSVAISNFNDMDNVYDQGAVNNLRQIFFPSKMT